MSGCAGVYLVLRGGVNTPSHPLPTKVRLRPSRFNMIRHCPDVQPPDQKGEWSVARLPSAKSAKTSP
eukprot:SAG11_NODE_440_length_9448_cov_3.356509_12_plen_67_part_00